jgi:hypothetical protein
MQYPYIEYPYMMQYPYMYYPYMSHTQMLYQGMPNFQEMFALVQEMYEMVKVMYATEYPPT